MRSVVVSLVLLGGTAAARTPPGSRLVASLRASPAPAAPDRTQPGAPSATVPLPDEAKPPPAVIDDEDADAETREPSKKQRGLAEKAERAAVHATKTPAKCGRACLTLRNQWTLEELPVILGEPPPARSIDDLLRDHYTNQAIRMDPRLAVVIQRAAEKFKVRFVEIVSGYRSPKYNLMLRKKGHAVARESQHPLGHAVDFRLAGVPTRTLYRFVRSLAIGGVGYYPHNGFVHADVGPLRTWKGE